jgi:hypothetical protein
MSTAGNASFRFLSLILLRYVDIPIHHAQGYINSYAFILLSPFPNCTYDFCCSQPRFDLDKCFQVLIKKDMEDQNDATMSEFLDRLVTAYRDPALMPIQYSADIDSLNRPLISSAGV